LILASPFSSGDAMRGVGGSMIIAKNGSLNHSSFKPLYWKEARRESDVVIT
jgi:hypothetical protein